MRLRKANSRAPGSSDEDEDSLRYRPQARIYPAAKTVSREHVLPLNHAHNLNRAARKTDSRVDVISSSDSEGSESSDESGNGVIEPAVRASSASESASDSKGQMGEGALTIPARPLLPAKNTGFTESPKLFNVGGPSLSMIRMQMSGRTPFLLRNVRRGFRLRCISLDIPVISRSTGVNGIGLVVKYTDDAAEESEVALSAWTCVLCHVLGNTLSTREMLACHLRWDHSDMLCEWTHVNGGITQNVDDIWYLRIRRVEDSSSPSYEAEHKYPITPMPLKIKKEQIETHIASVGTRGRISILPPVYLSPLTPKVKHEPISPESPSLPSSPPPGPQCLPPTKHQVAADIPRPRAITPPPPDAPLGPAAQPPYLPAVSDYGGPTVFFSSRPNGPCLFDLLGTLPLEPFGVLDWDIVDREEEVYESDPDIKDEYKVIQALWMRWIMLERNNFIGDYLKNTKAFVECFWKMIHRAAGWDALQYWLTVLLANRFLDAHQMAEVLRHYEVLTDMDNWYD